DLIECMLKIAAGDILDWKHLSSIQPRSAAIEVRIYAEDPVKNFQPSPGILTDVFFPENVRVDTWVSTGTEISQYFDPMIAKIIVHADDSDYAIHKLKLALVEISLIGICINS